MPKVPALLFVGFAVSACQGSSSGGGGVTTTLDGGNRIDGNATNDSSVEIDSSAPIDSAMDGSVDSAVDVATDSSVDAAQTAPDALVTVCTDIPNGMTCPGSTDPNGGERCFQNRCIGTYVVPAPIGSDSNPGTQALPRATLASGIAAAGQLQFTVPIYAGCAEGQSTAIFGENVDFVAGMSIVGGYVRSQSGVVTRRPSDCTVDIRPLRSDGIVFDGAAITNNTLLDGVTITAQAATQMVGTTGIAARNGASPTLSNVVVVASPQGTGPHHYGSKAISLERGSAVGTFRPRLVGVRATVGSTLGEGSALYVNGVSPDIVGGQYTSTATTGNTRVLYCAYCSGMTVTNARIEGGRSDNEQAVSLNGNVSNIVLTNNTIIGGLRSLRAANEIAVVSRAGITIMNCAGGPVEITGGTIVGTAGGNAHLANGIITECALKLHHVESIYGATGGGVVGGSVNHSEGVGCYQSAACTIENNGIIAGTGTDSSGGSVSAANSTVGLTVSSTSTVRSTSSLTPQVIRGGDGTSTYGMRIGSQIVDPLLDPIIVSRNRIESGRCLSGLAGSSIGATIMSNAKLENNIIVGHGCENENIGAILHLATDHLNITVVNNHIQAIGLGSLSVRATGISLGAPNATIPSGTFLNNTITATAATTKSGISEGDGAKIERLVANNLYSPGGTLLYSSQAGAFTTISGVNSLLLGSVSRANSNISSDPKLDGDYRPLDGSPNIDTGVLTDSGAMLPNDDYVGDIRTGTPDIGPFSR